MRIFLSVLILLSLNVFARDIRDEAMQELATIQRVFATGYAPREWKKQEYGWDLNAELSKAQNEIAQKSDLTIQEYRKIANNFLRSTKDYHVNISFYTTERATLPLQIAGAQGRYFIVWIDRIKLSEAQFPIQIGDEVLEFGGQPIADVVAELKARVNWSVEKTDEGIAQMYVTRRSARDGYEVPQGPVEIKVKRMNPATQKEMEITQQLVWEYTPEDATIQSALEKTVPQKKILNFDRQMAWPQWKMWKSFQAEGETPEPTPNPWGIGEKKTWVPALGTKIWEADPKAFFDAYIFRNEEGKLIGYVHIPYYGGGTTAFNEFRDLMKRFETSTDAMVIDQVNNPGGSIIYLAALQSVLHPQMAFNPPHRVALYPQMIAESSKELKELMAVKNDADIQKLAGGTDIEGYPVNYELAQYLIQYNKFVINEWKAGKTLTSPTYLWALDKITPNKEVTYSKPILVLVNHLCFSGGDFFPSILQDNKRAKIFGTRTAGAGGYVIGVSVPSSLGLEEFSFTGSLAFRIGNKPIENLGVTPDVLYDLTPEDFKSNYSGYKKAVNAAVTDLLRPAPPANIGH